MLKQSLFAGRSEMLRDTVSALLMIALIVLFSGPSVATQNQKPSEALRQITKMAEVLDRELDSGRVRPEEIETRAEAIVRAAAERAAQYKAADWKGDELYALANLYQRAEQFLPAAQAYRDFINSGAKGEKALNSLASLVRSLIEVDKFDEAATVMETLERSAPLYRRGYDLLLVTRIALRKALAEAFRDRGEYEKAAKQARAGFSLMSQLGSREMTDPLNRDARDYDQAALAAITIVSLYRLGKTTEAQEFRNRVEKLDFLSDPRLLSILQSELTAANLINNPSPGIKFQAWIGAHLYKPEDFRGKVLLLDFWAMWSAPSAEAFAPLRALQEKYGGQSLLIVGVTRFYGRSDKEDDLKPEQELRSIQDFLKRQNITWPVAVNKEDDLTNDDRFSVISLPTIVLVDRKGNVRFIRRGTGNWRALEKQVAKLIEGKQE
jgi:thiol-disulfide isomerase/thioredoxin